jgi:hypothetical protein
VAKLRFHMLQDWQIKTSSEKREINMSNEDSGLLAPYATWTGKY